MTYIEVFLIFEGSDGAATKALYDRLEQECGAAGAIAMNLFRATKTSTRAKVYRRGFAGAAYDTKGWAMDNLCKLLAEHGAGLGITWGWAIDESRSGGDPFKHVLYVDIPPGQVSFHSRDRVEGCPDYPGKWDEVRKMGPSRVCSWVAALLRGEASKAPEPTTLR